MIPNQTVASGQKPLAEVVVEGELSPFEDEAVYRILRKSFQIEQPSYVELNDENIATRVNVVFHHAYDKTIFTEVLQENWRDLKELFKQVTHRRGRAGASFTIAFLIPKLRLTFKLDMLSEHEVASALDQIGHLTGIVGQMIQPETMGKPIDIVEAVFDQKSDRWHDFRGFSLGESFVFDEVSFRWVPGVK